MQIKCGKYGADNNPIYYIQRVKHFQTKHINSFIKGNYGALELVFS